MTTSSDANPNPTLYQARLHWIIFLWPSLWTIGMLGLALSVYAWRNFAYLFAFFGLLWEISVWVTWEFTWLEIKKKQVLVRSGVLIRQLSDIPLDKIANIDIRQSILGSLLHYGSIVITGTGGNQQAIHQIDKPLTCRRYIEQLMNG